MKNLFECTSSNWVRYSEMESGRGWQFVSDADRSGAAQYL